MCSVMGARAYVCNFSAPGTKPLFLRAIAVYTQNPSKNTICARKML